ncbi:MAG TPA: hypothetical protein VIJ19_01240 [Opitutaceae bacterium]
MNSAKSSPTLSHPPAKTPPVTGASCSKYKDIKVHFTEAELDEHRKYKKGGLNYILGSRFLVLASSPVIWMCAIPIILADVMGTLYQSICFPIYGIPKVHRREYVTFDRGRLAYLNIFDKAACEYCAYVNGILAYFTEIAARTEQHWCPIKHSACDQCTHSRYEKFLDYGDARGFREKFEKVRRDYGDVDPSFSADRSP